MRTAAPIAPLLPSELSIMDYVPATSTTTILGLPHVLSAYIPARLAITLSTAQPATLQKIDICLPQPWPASALQGTSTMDSSSAPPASTSVLPALAPRLAPLVMHPISELWGQAIFASARISTIISMVFKCALHAIIRAKHVFPALLV